MFKFSLICAFGLILSPYASAQTPGAPHTPTPANTAVNVTLNPVLRWLSGGNTTSYDVHFGTNPTTPPFVGATANTNFATGVLNANTVYYWRIVAKNSTSGLTTPSPVWSFTTRPPGSSADEISGAIDITQFPFRVIVEAEGATLNPNDPVHSCSVDANQLPSKDKATIWFKFTAPFSAPLRINTFASDYDTVVTVYQGTTASQANELACNDDFPEDSLSSKLALPVVGGQTYLIQVSAHNTAPVASTLRMNVTIGQNLAVFRNGTWFLDLNGNGAWDGSPTDGVYAFGLQGDLPVYDDWNGFGRMKIGVFRNGNWYLDANGTGDWNPGTDSTYAFGTSGDLPITGDWTGSGSTRVGVFRAGAWFFDINGNGLWDGAVDRARFGFGQQGDLPVAGDWDGLGIVRIGVFRNGAWYLDINGNGVWDGTIVDRAIPNFGTTGDKPVVGDWSGDGITKLGVYRAGTWYLDYNGNGAWDGAADRTLGNFGASSDAPVAAAK